MGIDRPRLAFSVFFTADLAAASAYFTAAVAWPSAVCVPDSDAIFRSLVSFPLSQHTQIHKLLSSFIVLGLPLFKSGESGGSGYAFLALEIVRQLGKV